MDYHNKYIKYKTKYLQLKYHNQYGGGVVPCNKGLNNFIGTCWAVGIQMILFFGHLTSQEFNTVMEQFNISTTREKRITLRDSFIEEQINRVYKDLQLYDFLPAYIFDTPKRESLQIMLTTIIDRYNSKVFESPITIKPPGITNPTENPLRCEKVIGENFKKLFDYKIMKRLSNKPGGSIETVYLFCNLLSIIFLKHKVSITTYYNNFNLIDFKDETDLGILICTEGHMCCLFICNDKGQYYNDDDKQVYECDWKELLNTTATNLYVISKGCLKFIDDSTIDTYDEAQISKVLYLTKISKYEKESELDNDIKKAFTLTDTYTIRDPNLLMSLGDMYQFGTAGVDIDLTKAFNFYTRYVDSGAIHPRAYSVLGNMYYFGDVVKKDLKKAFDLFTISVNNRIKSPSVYYKLGIMYEKGNNTEINFEEAFKLYTQAIKFAINKKEISRYTNLCVRLGNMYETGLGTTANLEKAFNMYTIAMDNGNKLVYVKLGNMHEKGIGTTVNLKEAFKLYTLAMNNGNKTVYIKLGNMYEKGIGTTINLEEAFKLYTIAMENGDKTLYVKLGNMYENGTGVAKNLEEAFKLYTIAMENGATTLGNSEYKDISLVQSGVTRDAQGYLEYKDVNKDIAKAQERYTKGQKKFPGIKDFQNEKNEISTMVLIKSPSENNIKNIHRLPNDYINGVNYLLGQDLTNAKELLTKDIKKIQTHD
jgi:TPR repeat protein